MKIDLTSIFVDDQEKARRFYTEVLGFVEKHDVPMGEDRWLTVVSPEAPDGTELVLEPNRHPVASAYQKGLSEEGIPAMAFSVTDVRAEFDRLRGLGVTFTQEPQEMGPVTIAVLDDTCGNLVQLMQSE